MWEYKDLEIDCSQDDEPCKSLNELGKEGWELAHFWIRQRMFVNNSVALVIMKRKIS